MVRRAPSAGSSGSQATLPLSGFQPVAHAVAAEAESVAALVRYCWSISLVSSELAPSLVRVVSSLRLDHSRIVSWQAEFPSPVIVSGDVPGRDVAPIGQAMVGQCHV